MNKPAMKIRNTAIKVAVILVLLAVALFPAKYINSIYGYFPFLLLSFLILLSILNLVIIRGRISFEAEAVDVVCQRGEKVNITLKIVNKSVFVCPKAYVYLYVSNPFDGNGTVTKKNFAMYRKSASEFPFNIKMDHLGTYTAGVKMLQIYDMLGVFCVTVPGYKDFTVTVLPKTYLPEKVNFEDNLLTESQNAQKSTISDGFDYTGVREYAFGDSMKSIHWKLSAHSSEYMTKISEISSKSDMIVVIDFVAAPAKREILPDIYDCLIETALSITESALSENVECALLFVGHDTELKKIMIKGSQDYEDLVRLMPVIYTDSNPDVLDGAGILEKESHISNWSFNIILCTSKVTNQLIQELLTVKQQKRNPVLYYIIPPDVSSREKEELKAPLSILDDYNILYYLVSAEAAL